MKPLIPHLGGPWQLLFKPSKWGRYINDHSLIQDETGLWHLYGITSHAEADYSEQERYFVHAAGPLLGSTSGMVEKGKVCDNGIRAWAPAVISHEGRYYMYYGPSPTRFATSDELTHWMENTPVFHAAPLDALHRDHMVLQVAKDRWLMYGTGIHQKCGVVSVFESNDLVNWTFLRFALRTTDSAPCQPPWGATESPYVVLIEGLYYLFITYTDCKLHNYHNTLVFCSEDPTDFGSYAGDNENSRLVAKLPVHAPEVVRDADGQWYITTCGWRNYGTPVEGGVAIAKLAWADHKV